MKPLGKRWHTLSISDPRFDVDGYSEPDVDYRDEAIRAMVTLEKILKQPIPADTELVLLGTLQ